ncbi:hypothetical protein [Chroococcidiopsis sp. CCMEE 29]|uniref:hypothetical protein n=1 Tax=Chroococcidiopsis sp. CCMEE 29 TaxID=155894 RepID=UPI0020228276|nr:hypothetical protein [Chroococcidiopsis sp. CCMEE 29]
MKRSSVSYLDNLCRPLICLAFPALITTPVLAHQVQVSGDVAATFHIEPNHNPKVGEPAQAWFTLTRRGGQLLPLAQCNCQLAVYFVPRAKNAVPLMKPALKATNTEQYKQIPGTEITFNKAGAYELELTGAPKAGASFKPFKLTYTVTASGSKTATATDHH